MKITETISGYLSSSFFGSKNSKSNARSANLIQPSHVLYLANFVYLLTNIMAADADIIYPLDMTSNTNYQIEYDPLKFPDMKNTLISDCGVYLKGSSQGNYTATISPQCVSEDNVLGPSIKVAVETGKQISSHMKECLGTAMKYMCDLYYRNNVVIIPEDGNPVPVIIAFASVAAVGCVALCSVLIYKGCQNSDSSTANEKTPLASSSINDEENKNKDKKQHRGAYVVWNSPSP